MSKESVFIVDPYNEKHIELFKNFELLHQENELISTKLENISDHLSKDEYIKKKKEENEINEVLFTLEKEKINDFCSINGVKDMKTCTLYFPKLEKKQRLMIKAATDYALNHLGLESVFITIDKNDKIMINNLEKLSFESLGEENGVVTYMTEKEKILEKGRTI